MSDPYSGWGPKVKKEAPKPDKPKKQPKPEAPAEGEGE